MNTVLKTREASVRYLDAVEPPLVQKFDSLAGAPGGVARLRELILGLATAGRLVVTRGDQSHWQRRTLDQVGEWGSGGTPSKSHPEYYAGGTIPWLVIGDLNDGVVQSAATCISDLGLRNSSAKIVEPGTVLVAMYGSIGKLGVAGLRCATNQAIAFCRPNADVVTGDFLFLFLRSIRASLLQRGQGLAQQNISQKILRNIEISVPPLAEQARIVACVDELMQLCDALEAKGRLEAQQHARLLETLLVTLTDSTTPEELAANWQRVAEHFDLLLDRPEAVDVLEQTVLQLAVRGLLVAQLEQEEPAGVWLESLKKARANIAGARSAAMLPAGLDQVPFPLPTGWGWSSLSELGLITSGATPSKGVASNWLGDIPWVSPKDMKVPIIEDAQDHVSRSALKGSLSLIKPGSLLMVVRGMILAHSFPVAVTRVPVTINQDMKALTPLDCSVLPYLSVVCMGMKSEILAMVERSTHGTCKLDSAKIFSLPIPLPPLGEQARIVARVTELRRLCADLRQRLAASQATQSRLAEALVESVVSA